MEATGSNGQFYAYNTYATPPATNPLFQGFSRSQNVNKEIIFFLIEKIRRIQGTLVNAGLQGFLFIQNFFHKVLCVKDIFGTGGKIS